jgi:glyoxylase-like metal-dependent hydrolase (beta-lactamase superfamily II)
VEAVEIGVGAWCVTGTEVNWVIVRDGDDALLIDSGYPGDVDAVEQSLRRVGSRPEAVRAILLTHAHIDHVGGVGHFHSRYGTPVYAAAAELPNARREHTEQATPGDVARNAWRPGVLRWSMRIAAAGAMRDRSHPQVQPLPDGPLDLPGDPMPIATHGHTSGHTAYHLLGVGAIATGDALITGHAVSRLRGPQLCATMFNHCSPAQGLAALESLTGLDVGVVVPGHGKPLHSPVAAAVAAARDATASPKYW